MTNGAHASLKQAKEIQQDEQAQIIAKGLDLEELNKMNCHCRFIKDTISENPAVYSPPSINNSKSEIDSKMDNIEKEIYSMD